MSFILDALKKSESDRQRNNGPALYEVKVAAPRTQLPYWAIALAVLLGINLVIVAWALFRRPAQVPAPRVLAPQVASVAVPAAPAAVPAAPAPVSAATAPSLASTASPVAQPVAVRAMPPAAGAPAAEEAVAGPEQDREPAGNPDDYAPATEPSRSGGLGFHVRRATQSGFPLYSQVAAAGSGVPELRLDLHAYSPKPENRFVMINMKRLREGDSLPDGVKVESITPDGVILSRNGSKFVLPRE